MKRWIATAAAVALLVLPACTRTVVEEGPVVSPALLRSTSGTPDIDPSIDPIVQLVQRVRPAVVNVTTDTIDTGSFGGSGKGVGTGFVVRADGVIVTNYHVVERAQRITVITPEPDAEKYQARVIGGDEAADLAVLKIEAQGLPTIPLGDSAKLQLGQPAAGRDVEQPGGEADAVPAGAHQPAEYSEPRARAPSQLDGRADVVAPVPAPDGHAGRHGMNGAGAVQVGREDVGDAQP